MEFIGIATAYDPMPYLLLDDIKLGIEEPSSVEIEKLKFNDNLSILNVIPNLTTNETTINYRLSKDSYIRLSLVSSFGREIAILDEGWREADKYIYNLLTDDYRVPDGLYFIRLVTGDQAYTEKLIIIK